MINLKVNGKAAMSMSFTNKNLQTDKEKEGTGVVASHSRIM